MSKKYIVKKNLTEYQVTSTIKHYNTLHPYQNRIMPKILLLSKYAYNTDNWEMLFKAI